MTDHAINKQTDAEPTPFENFASIARKVFAAPRAEVETAIEAEKTKRAKKRVRRARKKAEGI